MGRAAAVSGFGGIFVQFDRDSSRAYFGKSHLNVGSRHQAAGAPSVIAPMGLSSKSSLIASATAVMASIGAVAGSVSDAAVLPSPMRRLRLIVELRRQITHLAIDGIDCRQGGLDMGQHL